MKKQEVQAMTKELPIYVMKENWWDAAGVEWLDFCHLFPHFVTVRKYSGSYEPRKRPFEVVVYNRSTTKLIQRVSSAWYATEKAAMSAAKTKSKFWGAHYATPKTETKKRKERTSADN